MGSNLIRLADYRTEEPNTTRTNFLEFLGGLLGGALIVLASCYIW
jgi:hypothetical protein